ncbi:unnamed protein product [Rhizophagus irregularis]|nr:unnamed protein product [Rhizophagus irregularis]
MAGNAELALQSLIQERFNQGESPDIYESRVRKHIVGFADDQILPALYTHLPPDLRNSEVLGGTSSWAKYVFPEPNPTTSQLSGSYFSRFWKV